jgi:hypothetical protein
MGHDHKINDTFDYGPWTMDYGLWSKIKLWTVDCGLWTKNY